MRLRTAIVTATTAAVLATSGVALAGATTSTSPSSSTAPASTPPARASAAPTEGTGPAALREARHRLAGGRAGMGGRHLRIRRLVRGAADVVTKTIGIDRATLRKGLQSGQSIGEIATEHQVAPQAVIDALLNAANTKLDAAVKAGKIPADRAAKIEEKLPARITKLVNDWHPKHLRDHVAP